MQWLSDCLETTKGISTVVIDNHSTDQTVNFIETHYPSVTLLKQNENLGFGKANNLGISYALKMGAESVFLLNQDAYLTEGTIQRLMKVHIDNPEYGILSPIHLNGSGKKLDLNFSKYLNQSNDNQFYSDYVLNKNLASVYDVAFINAAGWFISKKCLLTVGGFDPIFFHYGEDDNYCQRVLYHGLKIGVVPDTFIRHDRDDRNAETITFFKRNHFTELEKQLKNNYADINESNLYKLESELQRRKPAMYKSYLKLKFKSANFYLAELRLFEKIFPEIIESRKTNKEIGAHYLNY